MIEGIHRMNVKQALFEVGKYCPCPHDAIDTNLGSGRIWARCDDCGELIEQESLDVLRGAHDKFMFALQTLSDALEKDEKVVDK